MHGFYSNADRRFIMAIKKVNDASLTSVADAIRTKGGTSANLYFPDGFVDAIDAIPTGGDTFADLYINRTMTTYENLTDTVLWNSAFRSSNIRYINMPMLNDIYNYVFAESQIQEIDFPNVVYTNNSAYAFQRCGRLSSVKLENCKRIAQHMFDNATQITTFIAPNIERIDDSGLLGAFLGTYSSGTYIGSIELTFNKLTIMDNYACYGAKIKKLIAPNLTKIGSMCFYDSTIEEFTIPATCTTIGNNAFVSTKRLIKLIVEANLTTIPAPFVNNAVLEELDLSHCSQVPTLSNVSHITIPNTCVIKVPSSLEAEWKTATNWANFASQIQGV